MGHLQNNNIIIDNQHGFRPGHSCTTQLISLIEDVSRAMDKHQQTDLILLDFSKAFNTVPHHRLLTKLKYYRINITVCQWIQTWLTSRSQRVLVESESSESIPVTSGVPQGTVLGPLMFLLYINDITTNISSPLRLFADDCLLYNTINSQEDTDMLQQGLNQLCDWATTWQLNFNVTKCAVIRCTRSSSPVNVDYILNGTTLKLVEQHTYLGILIHKSLSWHPHIANITNKASKTLNFLKRNLSKCSLLVKASAYLTLVRPLLEYAAAVWDPHYQIDIQLLEKIQRRAARWVLHDYSRYSSVTSMLQHLNWPTLETRRKISRLQILYKALHDSIALPIPSYYQSKLRSTRHHHPKYFIVPYSATTCHQSSFFQELSETGTIFLKH